MQVNDAYWQSVGESIGNAVADALPIVIPLILAYFAARIAVKDWRERHYLHFGMMAAGIAVLLVVVKIQVIH